MAVEKMLAATKTAAGKMRARPARTGGLTQVPVPVEEEGSAAAKTAAGKMRARPAETDELTRVPIPFQEEGSRLDRFLQRQFPTIANSLVAKLARKRLIRMDGQSDKVGGQYRIKKGDAVLLPAMFFATPALKEKPRKDYEPDWLRKMVLYEDKNFFVLNKPPDVLVQPGRDRNERDISSALDWLREENQERPRIVHRLDRGASGTLVVARSLSASQYFSELLREQRRTKKTYWAMVHGTPFKREGRVVSFIDGKRAITEFRTLRTASETAAWLELRPVSGRKRQIRLHCGNVLKCPIMGDPLFRDFVVESKLREVASRDTLQSLHLHAWEIQFESPDGNMISVRAPPPRHFLRSLKTFGFQQYHEDWREEKLEESRKKRRIRVAKNVRKLAEKKIPDQLAKKKIPDKLAKKKIPDQLDKKIPDQLDKRKMPDQLAKKMPDQLAKKNMI